MCTFVALIYIITFHTVALVSIIAFAVERAVCVGAHGVVVTVVESKLTFVDV
jgi:hypothetical protein